MYDDVEVFCLFMGYTRSGHSLVGTAMDAHPEMVIAHEGKIFEHVPGQSITGGLRVGDREQLFDYLVSRARRQAEEGRRGFRREDQGSNLIPGGHHGQYTTLKVIGTKRGQEPPMAWSRNPEVFDELAERTGAEVRLLHVYRNPWDNIASMSRMHGDHAIGKYFRRADIIQRYREEGRAPMYDLALEDLIADPAGELVKLLDFYGVSADEEYIANCAKRIDRQPSASRKEREWTKWNVKQVNGRMDNIPWLQRYPRRPWL